MSLRLRTGSLAGVAVGVVGLLVFAAPASAADTSIAVSPSTVSAGGEVVVSGVIPTAACQPGNDVMLTSDAALFAPDGFGPGGKRDATGAFKVNYKVPAKTPAGKYQIGARCGGGNVGVFATLEVKAQVRATPSGAPQAGLGGTGRGGAERAVWLGAGALGAVLAALLAVVTVRRSHFQA